MDTNNIVQVISKELIKPSSPTPNNLKTHKLSLLDLISPPFYVPVVLFYDSKENADHAQTSPCLKQSLSKALTIYYPLAGTIDMKTYTIDCNDNGVEFFEARARARLADVIQTPKFEELQQYLPVDFFGGVHKGEGTIFMVQVNSFDCGGVAIGACISHVVADMMSFVNFLNAWAAIHRGEDHRNLVAPDFGAMARHFPARDLSDARIVSCFAMCSEWHVTKRFVFDADKLSALKREATICGRVPTRVEAVSAFIWRHFIERKSSEGKKSFALQAVNIRSRANPSFQLQNGFGNAIFLTTVRLDAKGEVLRTIPELASEMRRAIKRIDEKYVSEAKDDDRYTIELGELWDAVSRGGWEVFLFTSWVRFPIYEVDFGWGSPAWVGSTSLPMNNVAILMDTKSGDGIEVRINLRLDEVEAFETQFELITNNN